MDLAAEVDAGGDESAGRDSTEQRIAGLACADEEHEQVLSASGGEAAEAAHLDRDVAVTVCGLLGADRELVERHRGDVDERATYRLVAGIGDVEGGLDCLG